MFAQELMDRATIADILNRYAQAIDRRDWAVARAAYHNDAVVDYGAYRGSVDGLFDYISARHEAIEQSMHFMGQTVIDLEGRTAYAVSPNVVIQRRKIDSKGPVAMFGDAQLEGEQRAIIEIGSRYLDKLEDRGDGWKIANRTIVHEWMNPRVRDVRSPMQPDWQIATRDRTDPYFAFIAPLRGGRS